MSCAWEEICFLGSLQTAESVVQDPEWSALNFQPLGVVQVLGKCSVLVLGVASCYSLQFVCTRVLVVRSNAQALARTCVVPLLLSHLLSAKILCGCTVGLTLADFPPAKVLCGCTIGSVLSCLCGAQQSLLFAVLDRSISGVVADQQFDTSFARDR